MKVMFNRPVKIAGKIFPKGKMLHEIEDKHFDLPVYQHMLKSGDIVKVAEEKPAKEKPAKEKDAK